MQTLETGLGRVHIDVRGAPEAKVWTEPASDAFCSEQAVCGGFAIRVGLSLRAAAQCEIICVNGDGDMNGASSGQYFESVSRLANGMELVIGAPDDDWFEERLDAATVNVRPSANGLTISIIAHDDHPIEVPLAVVWAKAGNDAAWLAANLLIPYSKARK